MPKLFEQRFAALMNVAEQPLAARLAGRVTPYVVFVLVCVLAAEIVVGRTNLIWKVSPATDLGGLLKLEEVIIASSPKPRVLVFGSSRGREAFLPAQMERLMGLQRGEVLGLAMGGINILDALVIYRRNRSILSRAHTIIVQVDPFQFSPGAYPPPLRYRQFASWPDRMAYHGRARARLILDYVFSMDKALPAVSTYVKHWAKYGRGPERRFRINEDGRLAIFGAPAVPDDLHEPRNFTESGLRYWLNWGYPNYEHSAIMEAQFAELVRMAQSDGARVYAVYMPTTLAYLKLLRQVPGDPHERLFAALNRMARDLDFQIGWWDLPEQAGMTERDFADWGHFNRAGARKWTAHFAGWLRSAQVSRSGAGGALRASQRF